MAASAGSCPNLKHWTLVQCAEKLTTGISQDPVKVAGMLLSRGLAAPAQVRSAQLQTKDDHLKASELVLHMIGKVEMFPENFEVLLELLNTLLWLQDVVTHIRRKYEEGKAGSKTKSRKTEVDIW